VGRDGADGADALEEVPPVPVPPGELPPDPQAAARNITADSVAVLRASLLGVIRLISRQNQAAGPMRLTRRGRMPEIPGRDHLERVMTARPPAVTMNKTNGLRTGCGAAGER
jgi:hypothetical protein